MGSVANLGNVNGGASGSVPTLALRGGLSGEFLDFDLLPPLLADLDANASSPAVRRWAELLDAWGFDSRHFDPNGGRLASDVAAEGAWRLANRVGWVRDGLSTGDGKAVAALAGVGGDARRQALAPLLRKGVERVLVGQGGAPIAPLLVCAARRLAASTNLWVRVCPALLPVEVGAIVHWACMDIGHAESLVADVEINRDVAMQRVGPPSPDAPPGANLERHVERVMEFYMEHASLGERVPFSFGEELALTKLIGSCGLLREVEVGAGCPCLAEA